MQFSPGTRMPDDIKELPLMDQVALQTADPDLFSLLSGNAAAELEMAAINNAMAAAAPTQAERQDAAKAARIAELTQTNPYGNAGYYDEQGREVAPTDGNATKFLELEALDPQLAAKLKAQSRPAEASVGLTIEAANRVNADVFRQRMERDNQALQPQI